MTANETDTIHPLHRDIPRQLTEDEATRAIATLQSWADRRLRRARLHRIKELRALDLLALALEFVPGTGEWAENAETRLRAMSRDGLLSLLADPARCPRFEQHLARRLNTAEEGD